jgi:predicted GIY-YIG superfamily endonuclease
VRLTLASFVPVDCDMESRRFVYILRSDSNADRHYVGLTSDVDGRLHWHNHGPCGVTVRYRPWSLVVALEFADAKVAARFERYLKTGSGRAFATRHFGPRAGE